MSDFLYPLATVVLDFFLVLFCIRLSVSRRGPVWLLPTVLSLVLLFGSAVCLFAAASDLAGATLTNAASLASVYLFVVTDFWLITVIAFAYKTKPDKFLSDSRKAENEADYLQRRTKVVYSIKVDRRPTVESGVSGLDKDGQSRVSEKAPRPDLSDPYNRGPVSTVKVRRTSL